MLLITELLHHLLDVFVLDSFLRWQVRSTTHTLWLGILKTMPVSRHDLAHSLGSASGCKVDILGSLTTVTPHFPRRVIRVCVCVCVRAHARAFDGSDIMCCGHESSNDAKVVTDDLGQGT